MDSCRGSKRLGAGPPWPTPTISPVACEKFVVSAGAQVVSRSNRWQGSPPSEGEGRRTSPPPQSRRSPGIQASIAFLGDDDPEEVEVLKRALEKAQVQARTAAAEIQIAQAHQFIERARKRLAGADEKGRQAAEALRQAECGKAADIQAVAEAEALVERLRAQSAQPPTASTSATSVQGANGMEAEVEKSRAQAALLQAHVQDPPAAKRRAVGSRTVSVMPNTLIPGEVSAWVEECHALMLDAVNVGDRNRVLELSNLIAAGVERVTELTSPQH